MANFDKMTFLIKFYDAFDFSVCYKTATLTEQQLQAVEAAIKSKQVVVSGINQKTQTRYQWIPIKIWEKDSKEARAEITISQIAQSASKIF